MKGKEGKIYRLQKAFLCLEANSSSVEQQDQLILHQNGFNRRPNESSFYVKNNGTDFLIICLYVNDLIYCSINLKLVEEFKKKTMEEFEMIELINEVFS